MNTYVIRGLDKNSRKVKIEIEAEELEEAVLISKNLCTTVHSVELLFEDEISEPLSSEDKDSPALVEQVKEEIYSESNTEEKISQVSLSNDSDVDKDSIHNEDDVREDEPSANFDNFTIQEVDSSYLDFLKEYSKYALIAFFPLVLCKVYFAADISNGEMPSNQTIIYSELGTTLWLMCLFVFFDENNKECRPGLIGFFAWILSAPFVKFLSIAFLPALGLSIIFSLFLSYPIGVGVSRLFKEKYNLHFGQTSKRLILFSIFAIVLFWTFSSTAGYLHSQEVLREHQKQKERGY